MKLTRLKNGTEVPEPIVATTMETLLALWQTGIPGFCLLHDLREICQQGRGCRVTGSEAELVSWALLQEDGQPHEAVRDIVLCAFEGEGAGFKMVSPVAEA